jgi:glutathione reductase (NADPH)
VALIEADRLGGTCVIRGCVPKKLMMYAAVHGSYAREAAAYGWEGLEGRFDMARWADAKAREIRRLEDIYRDMLTQAGVETIAGRAHLLGAGRVAVNGRELEAPRVLIATGGTASQDALPGLALAMTSNEVLDLRALPRTLLVVGGGYIAVEFASILAGLGTQVTLAYRDTLPLRGFDLQLRQGLAKALTARGIELAAGIGLKGLTVEAGRYTLTRSDGSVVCAEAALNATGRRPNSGGIGLAEAGVVLDGHGAIRVDAQSRSSLLGVWAVGDVTNRVNLTPVAIAEGRAFADTEFGGKPTEVSHTTVPSAVFTEPALGTVGLSESAAAALGPVHIFEADFRPMRTAFAGSSQRSYMKLVVDGLSDRVLGIHMIGAEAPEIIQSLAVALSCGATKADFDRTFAVHPTVAEEFMLMRAPTRKLDQSQQSATAE